MGGSEESAARGSSGCQNEAVHDPLLVGLAGLPTAASVAIAAAIFIVGVIVAAALGRRSGRRAIASRLVALGQRIGDGGLDDDASIEVGLSFLEQVIGEATHAVAEQSADALRLRRALDTLAQGVVICDESGGVVYRNQRAQELMASRHGDALAAQAVTDLLADAWRDGGAERTLDLFGPPRSTLAVRAELIDDGRRPVGVVALIEDISERRRLEEVRRDFVANVSHELKTPIGALGLLAETLLVEKDADVAARLADRIHAESFRVSRIIDDLLDLSRIESEMAPPREPVLINLVMAEAVERVRATAEQRRITLVVDEPAPAITIQGDRRQLVSAMHALLENAITYSYEDTEVRVTGSLVPAGEVTQPTQPGPSGEVGEAWVVGQDGEEWFRSGAVRLSVTDRGIGIPARDRDRIFERFYRVDAGRSRETGGTGLGLAIVRHVAQNHHGRVQVDSREGEGSTFALVLPMQGTP